MKKLGGLKRFISNEFKPYYKLPLSIAIIYAIVGCIWIFISNSFLENNVTDIKLLKMLMDIKRIFFVGATSILIFFLVLFGTMKDKKHTQSELTKNERALKESKKELADVTKAINESSIIAITDKQGIITFVNDKFCEISKYTREELIGNSHRLVNSGYHSNDFFQELWQVIRNGNTWKGDIRNRAKDGSLYWVSTTIVPFLDDEGKPYQYVSIRTDITEKKSSAQALMESEEKYERLVEISPEAILIHTNGLIRYANPACVKLLGATSKEELVGKAIIDFSHPLFIDFVNERIELSKQAHVKVPPTEEKIISLDGRFLDVEVTGATLQFEGKTSFLTMIRDVTRRKQAEEALRNSEEQYRLITENMTDVVRLLDRNGIVTYASPSHEWVLGFPPLEFEGRNAFELVHPDDKEIVKKEYAICIEQKKRNSAEFRYKHAKGHWVWLEAHFKPVLDEEGNILYLQTVGRDITDRKLLKDKLSYMAFHDSLTGIPNRSLFHERLIQTIKEAERYDRKFAIMYVDLDNFKPINDTFGHDVGDELLKQFAERVQRCLRESDTLARQGGDEFTILLPEIKENEDAILIAERVLTALQKPWMIYTHEFQTTSSIGIAYYPENGTSFGELMKNADTALYEAKACGRNNIKVF